MRLKELRLKKGVSQTEVGDVIGVCRSAICQYEKGVRLPNAEDLVKLANYFNVSVDDLLGLEEKQIEHIVDSDFEKEIAMIDFIQSEKSRFAYYEQLSSYEKGRFMFLLMFTKKELAEHKKHLILQSKSIDKIAWFLDGKASFEELLNEK